MSCEGKPPSSLHLGALILEHLVLDLIRSYVTLSTRVIQWSLSPRFRSRRSQLRENLYTLYRRRLHTGERPLYPIRLGDGRGRGERALNLPSIREDRRVAPCIVGRGGEWEPLLWRFERWSVRLLRSSVSHRMLRRHSAPILDQIESSLSR